MNENQPPHETDSAWPFGDAGDPEPEHRLPPLMWPAPPPAPAPLGDDSTGAPPPGRFRRRLGAAVVAALVLLASGVGIGWSLTRGSGTSVQAQLGASGRTDTGSNAQAVAGRVDRAVVDINTFIDESALSGTPSPGGAQPLGAGTGMILTSTGEILTNNHVVAGATTIRVTVAGRGTFPATVVGVDPNGDVALLRLSGVTGLPTVTLGNSTGVHVGQQVVAIGNALGQGGAPTVTTGTVTATGRSISVADDRGGSEHLVGLIQTDAPIAPGDSGGPLVNSSGQVIGMITASARSSFSESASAVGFAISSNSALRVVNEIRTGHESGSIIIGPAGFLGVEVRNLDGQTAARLGLGVTSGALVTGVVPGTPAARAGIPQFAVITAIDGQPVASAAALGPALHSHDPGQSVGVTWVDRHGTHTVTVVLVAGPAV